MGAIGRHSRRQFGRLQAAGRRPAAVRRELARRRACGRVLNVVTGLERWSLSDRAAPHTILALPGLGHRQGRSRLASTNLKRVPLELGARRVVVLRRASTRRAGRPSWPAREGAKTARGERECRGTAATTRSTAARPPRPGAGGAPSADDGHGHPISEAHWNGARVLEAPGPPGPRSRRCRGPSGGVPGPFTSRRRTDDAQDAEIVQHESSGRARDVRLGGRGLAWRTTFARPRPVWTGDGRKAGGGRGSSVRLRVGEDHMPWRARCPHVVGSTTGSAGQSAYRANDSPASSTPGASSRGGREGLALHDLGEPPR